MFYYKLVRTNKQTHTTIRLHWLQYCWSKSTFVWRTCYLTENVTGVGEESHDVNAFPGSLLGQFMQPGRGLWYQQIALWHAFSMVCEFGGTVTPLSCNRKTEQQQKRFVWCGNLWSPSATQMKYIFTLFIPVWKLMPKQDGAGHQLKGYGWGQNWWRRSQMFEILAFDIFVTVCLQQIQVSSVTVASRSRPVAHQFTHRLQQTLPFTRTNTII